MLLLRLGGLPWLAAECVVCTYACTACMQIQQEQLVQLRAELEQRKRCLEEAQRDLGQALEEYENEVGGAVLRLLG